MKALLKNTICAATFVSMIWPLAAMAQDNGGVEQVVVTARRVEERLQDVPMSITVLNQRMLTNYNISSAGDLAAYIPALSANSEFGQDATSFVIRGFSQDIGTSPTVGMYFADVVEPRGGFGGTTIHAGEGAGPGDLFDLQNVQVLKGPQGTLFGRNTTGGAILLVPQRPTDQFGGYVEASAGNYGMERLQGVINIPVADWLRIRFGADQETRDGYLSNISGIGPGHLANVDYVTYRLSVDADLSPNVNNYTIMSFTNSDNTNQDAQVVACDPTTTLFGALYCAQLAKFGPRQGPYTVENSTPNPRSLNENWRIVNKTTWSINDNLNFVNIASYSQLRVINASSLFGDDFTSFPINGPKLTYQPPFLITVPLAHPLQFTAEDQPPGVPLSHQGEVTEEPRLQGTAFDGRMNWQAGLYFEESYPIGLSGSSGPNVISCQDFVTLTGCEDTLGLLASSGALPIPTKDLTGNVGRRTGQVMWQDYGLYAQDTYNFTDQWALTTGIRYTDDVTSGTTTRYQYYFAVPGAPPTARFCETPLPGSIPPFAEPGPPNCVVQMKQDSSAPTGLANLSYKPTDDVMLYVQYARGYRQGGLGSTFPIGFETFQPEQLNAYEAGVKSTIESLWGISGTANAAFFYNDFTDQQVLGTFVSSIPGAPPNAGILNVGSSRIYGTDLDTDLALTEKLNLQLGWTYLESKLLKAPTAALSGGPTIIGPNGLPTPFYSTFGPNEPQGNMLALTPKNKLNVTPTYTVPMDEALGELSLSLTYVYTSKQLVYGVGPFSHIPDTNVLNLNVNWEKFFGSQFDLEFFMTNVTNLLYPSYIDNFANPASSHAANYGVVAEDLAPPRMYGARVRFNF